MSVSGIGIVNSNAVAANPASSLTQEDFLNVLITQLQFQDPLQPMNDEQFLGQLAQFSALEVATQQSSQLDTLLAFNSANQAIALLGKTVDVSQSGAGRGGAIATGSVTALDFSTGSPLLTVKTSTATLTGVLPSDVTLIQ